MTAVSGGQIQQVKVELEDQLLNCLIHRKRSCLYIFQILPSCTKVRTVDSERRGVPKFIWPQSLFFTVTGAREALGVFAQTNKYNGSVAQNTASETLHSREGLKQEEWPERGPDASQGRCDSARASASCRRQSQPPTRHPPTPHPRRTLSGVSPTPQSGPEDLLNSQLFMPFIPRALKVEKLRHP